ncbi:hypothetical protein T4D_9811 [Trichinella pseudospiralis]|uniref:Uncharacterized protein n=1 Tax=Trichinella pseudospiralis TaxID=6337 RepID=A0A0V1G0I8_TRIPS|nr:hypothetical protein T4D_9811 [Trichinella pseudospiralis]
MDDIPMNTVLGLRKNFLFLLLFLVFLSDNFELRLVINRSSCRDAMCTDFEITTVISQKDHMEGCTVDEHIAYKMGKKTV